MIGKRSVHGSVLLMVSMLLFLSLSPLTSGEKEEIIQNGVVLVFEVPEPTITVEEGSVLVEMDGWGSNSYPGASIVPERTFYIPLEGNDIPVIAGYRGLEKRSIRISLPSQKVPSPSVDQCTINEGTSSTDMVEDLGMITVDGSLYLMLRLSPFTIVDWKEVSYFGRVEVDLRMDGMDHVVPVTVPSDLGDPTVSVAGSKPLWVQGSGSISDPIAGGVYHDQDPPVECLIITSSTLNNSLQPLATWKTQRGVPTEVVETGWIYSTFTGSDNQEKIRNCTKAYYKNESLKWVVLGGDDSVVPTRMAYIPDGYGDSGSDGSYVPADSYYGDLNGTGHTPYDWDGDNDGLYGEYSADGIDLSMEAYVGRFSATSSSAMTSLVNNILNYEKSPPNGTWFKRAVLAGAYSNYDTSTTGNNTTDEARLKEAIRGDFIPNSTYDAYTLYEGGGIWPSTYSSNASLTTSNLISAIDTGAFMVNLAGHGSNTGIYRRIWSSDDGDGVCESGEYYDTSYYSTSASQNNGGKKPLFYNDACNNGNFDSTWCLTEDILRDVGIGAVGAGRVSWYAVGWTKGTDGGWYNQGHDYRFWEQFFAGNYQPGKALALSHSDYISDKTVHNRQVWKNLVQYNLMGDPEIPVWTQVPSNFTVTYSDPIPTPGNYQFTITDGSNPVSGARVTLMDGSTFWGTSVSDSSGKATMNLPQMTASMTLTVTKHNFNPYIRTVTVGDDKEAPRIENVTFSGNSTTGDGFQVSANVTDNLEVRNVSMAYGWGTSQPSSPWNVSMLNNGRTYFFNGTHPLNSTDPLWYKVSSNDSKGNWANTSWIRVSISDNDLPEFLIENTTTTCTTGDEFVFEVHVDDNIAVDHCYVDYHLPGVGRTYALMSGTGTQRSLTIDIPSSQTGYLSYHFNLTDTSGNLKISSITSKMVFDNDSPTLNYATVDLPPTTGDFTWFYVNAVDNIGMFRARLVYFIEDQDSGNATMNYDGNNNYSHPLQFDTDKLSDLTYQFYLEDGSGNIYLSPVTSSRTIDNDRPRMVQNYIPGTFFTGDKHDISVKVEDNIGINDVVMEITFPDSTVTNFTMEENLTTERFEFRLTFPSSPVGNVSVRFFITDTSGNLETTEYFNSPLIDNDAPLLIEDRSDTSAVCGENVSYVIDASDNSALHCARLVIDRYLGPFDMEKASRSDTFTLEVVAPHSLENIVYHFEIEDVYGNIHETGVRVINVSDLSLPVCSIIGFDLPDDEVAANLTTGDNFPFVSLVEDNIMVQNVWLEIIFPGNSSVNTYVLDDDRPYSDPLCGYYYCLIDIPFNVTGEVLYRLIAVDTSGNNMTTQWYSIPLVDNDAPSLVLREPDSNMVFTDSVFILHFDASDNIGITSWKLDIENYPGWEYQVLEIEEGYRITVSTDEKFLNGDAILTFTVSDGDLGSDPAGIRLKIKDRTSPVIRDFTGSPGMVRMRQSEATEIDVNIMDNSGSYTASVVMTNDEGESLILPFEETENGIVFTVSNPLPGDWTINVSAHDDGMNSAWRTGILVVEDDVEPVVEMDVPDIDIRPGEETTITPGDTSDDSEITTYTWTVTGPGGSKEIYQGPELKFNASDPGQYNITLAVKDEFGNTGETTTTITVTPDRGDEDQKGNDWLLYGVLIASVLLFIVVLVVILLVVRKKREPDYVVGGKQEGSKEDEEELVWG